MSLRSILTNDDNVIATIPKIRQLRDEAELQPVPVGADSFDADEVALRRMDLALQYFDDLPTLVDGQLAWRTFAGTEVWYTKTAFAVLVDQIKNYAVRRAALLHAVARQLEADGTKTISQVRGILAAIVV